MTQRLPRLRYVLFCVAVVLLPCELLLDPQNTFYADWHNHLWAMSYYSAFFRAHLAFPDVIHTQQIVGLVYPMFYAHWFYAVGGVFGSVLGADVAVRLVVIALVSGQFYLVFRLFQTYSLNNGFALVMAIVVTWSIYPLTNLYNRGALTEFAAVCLLNMSICSLLMALTFANRTSQALSILRAGLFFTLSALTHPITGTIGGLLLCALFVVVMACQRDQRHLIWISLTAAFLSLMVLAPWLYALREFSRDLPIGETHRLMTLDFDTVLSRMAPFPLDSRSLLHGTHTETPHLDAQINMAIVTLLAALWLAFKYPGVSRGPDADNAPLFGRRVTSGLFNTVFAGLSALAFVYFFVISLGMDLGLVPTLIARVQYGYRLVSYQNIFLLFLALAATQHFAGRISRRDPIVAGMAIALMLSFSGVLLKLAHANVVRHGEGSWRIAEERTKLPETFYSIGDYNVLRQVSAAPQGSPEVKLAFAPSSGGNFAEIAPVELQVDVDSVVKSNVYLFPWNKILVDSLEIPQQYYSAKEYLRTTQTFLASFVLPAGRHTISYRFAPDPAWRVLRQISVALLSLWVVGMCAMPLLHRRPR